MFVVALSSSRLDLWLTWTLYPLILRVNRELAVFCSLMINNGFLRQEVSRCVCWRRWSPYQGPQVSKVWPFAFNTLELHPSLGSFQWRERLKPGDVAGQKKGSGLRFPAFLWLCVPVSGWELCLHVWSCVNLRVGCGCTSPFRSAKTHWFAYIFSLPALASEMWGPLPDISNPGHEVWLELIRLLSM